MRSDNLFFFFDFADPPNYILKLGHIRKYTYINIYHFMSGYTAHVAWSKVAGMKLSFWQPTHFLSACKPLQSRVFLVEQLTVHTNINVWKYLYSATEPSHIWVSGVGMLIKTGRRWRKRPICELEESLQGGEDTLFPTNCRTQCERHLTHGDQHLLLISLIQDAVN